MKIAFLCDLHLPFDTNALQYDVLAWVIDALRKSHPSCIVYAGDVTCDGNEAVYDAFIDRMNEIGIPFLYIPGNSDLRDVASRDAIAQKASACESVIGGISIFALNDCDKRIADEQLAAIERADEHSIVFMHHPIGSHKGEASEALLSFRERHPRTMIFYGHLHLPKRTDCEVSLQALDPDKAIGECPCITYYDTESGELSCEYYESPMPEDFCSYLGISCYDALGQIELAIERRLKYLELRPKCCTVDRALLCDAVARWRAAGGEQLSIHLSDVGWADGALSVSASHGELIELAKLLKADRLTQHVPKVSVCEVNRDPSILDRIVAYLAEQIDSIPHGIVLGVENMHMTAKDGAGEDRRFGYIPEECLHFMRLLDAASRQRVGINFDIGHARNNAPYSQKYQISTWLSMVGEHVVGYHIHQVLHRDGAFENHMPITDVYGSLISYASFFKYWSTGRIAKAPLILEMRPKDAYKQTLDVFFDGNC